jgi:hypothetical protein
LAHTTGSEVELAYQRSDLFEKRKQVLDEWASFVVGESLSIQRFTARSVLRLAGN